MTITTKTSSTIIATRRTADGKTVKIWSDGGISGHFGTKFEGVPMRCRGGQDRLDAAWLFAGEISLYDEDELAALYTASLKVARKGGNPGDVRRATAAALAQYPAPVWEPEETDRDGRVVSAWWRCPVARWPGVAVYRAAGLYQIFWLNGDVAYQSGFSCKNMADLMTKLDRRRSNERHPDGHRQRDQAMSQTAASLASHATGWASRCRPLPLWAFCGRVPLSLLLPLPG